MLKPETQKLVELWIKEAGWKVSGDLLKYLDEEMAHPDRKYWMENPWKTAKTGVRSGVGFVVGIGIRTIPELAPISYKLANLGAQNLDKARKQLYLIEHIQSARASDPNADVSVLETELDEQGYELYLTLEK